MSATNSATEKSAYVTCRWYWRRAGAQRVVCSVHNFLSLQAGVSVSQCHTNVVQEWGLIRMPRLYYRTGEIGDWGITSGNLTLWRQPCLFIVPCPMGRV